MAGIFWKAVKNCSKKTTQSEFQFFTRYALKAARIVAKVARLKLKKKKKKLLFWLEEPGKKSPGKPDNHRVRGEESQERTLNLNLNSACLCLTPEPCISG